MVKRPIFKIINFIGLGFLVLIVVLLLVNVFIFGIRGTIHIIGEIGYRINEKVFTYDSNAQKMARNDIKKGKLKIYVYGEFMNYELKYRKLLAQNNIELHHMIQSEMDPRWAGSYNVIMEMKIANLLGKNFLDSILKVAQDGKN